MDNQLDKIIKIIKRTGEKVVVLKDDAEFIISSLDDYARLIEGPEPVGELSEAQMLDKINRDIAAWRATQDEFKQKDDLPDLFDQPETPRYQSLDNIPTVQDKIDHLSDHIFTNDNDESEDESDFELAPTELSPTKERRQQVQTDNESEDDIDFDDSFDFEESAPTKEKSQQVKTDNESDDDIDWDDSFEFDNAQQDEKPEILDPKNNFGYTNPTNTDSDDNFGKNLEEDDEDFENEFKIPPPPDINQ